MDTYHKQAALLKLAAHPIRLHILDVLRSGDECVCHLSAVLGKPQPYISQQLAILRNSGVIVDEREGTNIFYHLVDAKVAQIVQAACAPLPGLQHSQAATKRRVIQDCHCPKCQDAAPERG